MVQHKNNANRKKYEWYRDPIWQFWGVIVAIVSVVVSIVIATNPGSNGGGTSSASSTNVSNSGKATQKPLATIPSGKLHSVNEIRLSCGGCDDPILVTIDSADVQTENNRMAWKVTVRNTAADNLQYDFGSFSLQKEANSEAHFASGGSGSILDPGQSETVYLYFPFIPYHETSYHLNVRLEWGLTEHIDFDPVSVTF